MTDRESSTMALGIGPSAKAQYVLVRTTLPPSFCFKRSQKAMSMTNISGSSKTTSTKNDDSGQSSRSNIIVESSGLTAAATAASSSPAPSSHGVTTTTKFTVKAPGRICLFGEHQDYLGFPVISMAIPLHCIIDVTVDVKNQNNNDNSATNSEDNTAEPESKKPRCTNTGRRIIHLDIPQLSQSKIYDLDNLPPRQTSESLLTGPDFALSSIYEVLDEGWSLLSDNNESSSFHVTCRSISEIVMQAGCSSSTAFITAWILMLSKLATTGSSSSSKKLDVELELNPIYLGKLAHRAEVSHFNAPGGTMDHVTIALGSTTSKKGGGRQDNGNDESGSVAGPFLRIGPGQWDVLRLPPPSTIATAADGDSDCNNDNEIDYYFVLAYSGEPKDTMKHLQRCKGDRLDILKEKLNGDWDNATGVLKGNDSSLTVSSDERELIETTLINHRTEIQAAELLTTTTTAALIDKIGSLMNEHHVALRDGLKLSTKRLEDMRNAALNAGAVGYKLVGSGGGGCSISLTSSQDQAKKIATAIRNVNDTIQTWIITTKQPCRGAHIEEVAK